MRAEGLASPRMWPPFQPVVSSRATEVPYKLSETALRAPLSDQVRIYLEEFFLEGFFDAERASDVISSFVSISFGSPHRFDRLDDHARGGCP